MPSRSDADCSVPACDSSKEALEKSFRYLAARSKGSVSSSSSTATATASASASASAAAAPVCPLGRESLGYFTWSVLHSVAANFPEKADQREREAGSSLVRSMSVLYPCVDCRE